MPVRTKEQIERDEQIYQITTLVAGRFTLQEALDKLAEAAVKITGLKACSPAVLLPPCSRLAGSANAIAGIDGCVAGGR